MTDQDKRTAALLLEWSRTLVDHGLSWEEWESRRECFCPGDCNCRHQGQPWNRLNYCGCKAHQEIKA